MFSGSNAGNSQALRSVHVYEQQTDSQQTERQTKGLQIDIRRQRYRKRKGRHISFKDGKTSHVVS